MVVVKCKICKKSVLIGNISTHIKNHETSRNFNCETCKQHFKSNNALKNHNRKFHNINGNESSKPRINSKILIHIRFRDCFVI